MADEGIRSTALVLVVLVLFFTLPLPITIFVIVVGALVEYELHAKAVKR